MEQALQILKIVGREKLTNVSKTATAKMFNKYPKDAEVSNISEKASSIINIINISNFGCRKIDVAKLCEVLIGENIVEYLIDEEKDNNCQFPPYLYACFTLKTDHGDYKKDEIWMIVDIDKYWVVCLEDLKEFGVEDLDENEMEFNECTLNFKKIRPSTEEEIDGYVEQLFHYLNDTK